MAEPSTGQMLLMAAIGALGLKARTIWSWFTGRTARASRPVEKKETQR